MAISTRDHVALIRAVASRWSLTSTLGPSLPAAVTTCTPQCRTVVATLSVTSCSSLHTCPISNQVEHHSPSPWMVVSTHHVSVPCSAIMCIVLHTNSPSVIMCTSVKHHMEAPFHYHVKIQKPESPLIIMLLHQSSWTLLCLCDRSVYCWPVLTPTITTTSPSRWIKEVCHPRVSQPLPCGREWHYSRMLWLHSCNGTPEKTNHSATYVCQHSFMLTVQFLRYQY